MVTLEVNPAVLQALKAAFPNPQGSAERALTKYISVLSGYLNQSIHQGRDPMQVRFDLYSVPTSKLANLGGSIGSDKERVHKWLERNGLALVEHAAKGSNLTGQVSSIRLSELVCIKDDWELIGQNIAAAQTDRAVDLAILGDKAAHLAIFRDCYPTFDPKWSGEELAARYDELAVDVKSLMAYIYWLRTSANKKSRVRIEHACAQAQTILAVAQVLGGRYLQPKKPSDFGRMYYEGTSVQNVNKELRRAILGNCWEYDIRSSVVAWKLGEARLYLYLKDINKTVDKAFPMSYLYLDDKTDLFGVVRRYVFVDASVANYELQIKILKQAFTAIAFGARATTKGWQTGAGQWTNPALVEVIKDPDTRSRFLQDQSVIAFIREQQTLDSYLMGQVSALRPDLLKRPILQTKTGRASRSKVVAFLYQHEESKVMAVLRATAVELGRPPIACVHDAVFFRQRLGLDRKERIEYAMQQATGNPYWRLNPTELKRWERESLDEVRELAAHRARIAQEEEQAKGYKSRFFESWRFESKPHT